MPTKFTETEIAYDTGTFTDLNGNLIDPTTVEFQYAIAPPSSAYGTTTTLTYTGNSVAGVGIVARLSQGVYQVWVDTTGNPGTYKWQWKSTGQGQAITDPPGVWVVQPSAL